MFGNLFGKKEEERSAMNCNHANENPNVCYCEDNCYCWTHTCKGRIGKPGIHPEKEMFDCLKCGREVEAGWKYVWKGKDGFMHRDTCGRNFHIIGDYLLDKAQEVLEKQRIKVNQTKEKFGMMMLYASPQNDIEKKMVRGLQDKWKDLYPEFDWYFR